MFLHSGASLHGHEYSNKPAPTAQQHTRPRSPLLRSAFASPKARPLSLDAAATQPAVVDNSRRPVSDYIPPRLAEPVVRFLEPLDSDDDDDDDHLPTPMTEDVMSMSGSEFSDDFSRSSETTEAPRRRKSQRRPRTSTTCALAYPAPRFAGKSGLVKKVAPKLYLQLQEISQHKRPKPIIDVFPSSLIAGPVIAPRLAKRFPRLFGPKGQLGSSDIVLMRSEDYDKVSEDADSEDDESRLEKRQPIAVLSPVKKPAHTEIVLDDGSVWVAKPLATGSVDFVHVNAHGVATTARWVKTTTYPKKTQQTSEGSASKSNQTESPSQAKAKYRFSIINPLSRRHPVMATLTPEFLSIQDSYMSVSTSSGRYPPSKPILGRANTSATPHRSSPLRPTSMRSLSMNAASEYDSDDNVSVAGPQAERTSHPVDNATKLLISVTAVWIALQGGWSPYYTPAADHGSSVESAVGSGTTSPPSRLGRRGTRSRGNSIEIATLPAHGHPTSPLPGALHSREQSPVRSYCSGTHLPAWWETRTTSSPVVPTAVLPPPPVRSPTPDRSSFQPRRATSTGAAFMQRSRIASINRAEEESDPEHNKPRARCLSSGGQRPTTRHSVDVTPTTPVQKAVLEAGPNVHPAPRDRSYQVNINTRLNDQPIALRQGDSSRSAMHVPPGPQPPMQLPGPNPAPAPPVVPVPPPQPQRRPFGTKTEENLVAVQAIIVGLVHFKPVFWLRLMGLE